MTPKPHPSPSKFIAVFLSILFLLSGTVYLTVWKNAPYLTDDSPGYMRVAQDLQDGSLDHLHDRTIGYPLILLITQSSTHPAKSLFVFQLLLHFAAVSMIVAALSQHGVSRKIIFGFTLAAVLPPFLSYTAYVLTESVLSFCLILAFFGLRQWLFCRSKFGLTASITATIFCGMIRPSLFAVGIACAALLAIWQKTDTSERISQERIRMAQRSLIVLPVLVCAAMIAFNRQRFHYTGLTPMMWKYLSTKTVRLTERIPNDVAVKQYLVATRDKALVKPNSYHNGQAYMHDLDRDTLAALTRIDDEGELAQYMTRIQIRLIAASPLTYLLEAGSSMVTYWFPAKFAPQSDSRVAFWLWVIVDFGIIGLFFLVMALFLSSLVLLRHWKLSLGDAKENEAIRQGVLSCLLVLGIIWYNAIVSNLFSVGETRYRYPTDILILFFIVLSCQTLRKIKEQVVVQKGMDCDAASAKTG